jgi:hypothetical protein
MTTALHTELKTQQSLDAGLHWLYATVQPTDALVERRGARLAVQDRVFRFVPLTAAGTPLIVVDLATVQWSLCAASPPLNALPRYELPRLATELAKLNIPTAAQHYHGLTGTIALDIPAHPSLLEAVARFDRGCPHHHRLVCDAPIRDGGHACTWRRRGHHAALWPTV